MPSWLSYLIAFGASAALHIVLAVALSGDWSQPAPEYREPPKSIQVTLVDLAEHQRLKQAEKDKAAAAKRKQHEAKRREQRKKEQQRKKAAEQKRKQQEAQRQAKLKAEADRKRSRQAQLDKQAQKRKEFEAQAQRLRDERDKQQEQQRAAEQAAADAEAQQQADYEESEIVGAYTNYIVNAVAAVWSRPPSARNNMQVTLQIDLVPSGRMINVRTIESSGNAAYDQSAVRAVRNADFSKLKDIDPVIFENNFRILIIKLRPEDLYR